jgi:Predicted AAA-ATPase
VQNDIDGKNKKGKKYKAGQYFVLNFDFSTIPTSADLAEANQNLIVSLNYSIEKFYETYATYLDGDVTSLCKNIDSMRPDISLQRCNRLVQRAISRAQKEKDKHLASVQGIYLLIDEYDAFTNNYLEPPNTVEPHKSILDDSPVGETFRTFWCTVKLLFKRGIEKIFVTGISPLSLSGVGSAYNIARNLSFHQDLAGLCGLTSSDLEATLKEIGEDDKLLSQMTKCFNGYHFCRKKRVETVYNTETCLAYLQSIVDGGDEETEDPPNSEVAEKFLEKFATSASVITDFEKALKCDQKGDFIPLAYNRLKYQITLRDLVC